MRAVEPALRKSLRSFRRRRMPVHRGAQRGAHSPASTRLGTGRLGTGRLRIAGLALSTLWVVGLLLSAPGRATDEPTPCLGQALVQTLTNETDRSVDGLHWSLHGPESVWVDPNRHFGEPAFQALDPDGRLHLRFGGPPVAPGESVRIALCAPADASRPPIDAVDAIPSGRQGALAWLLDDERLPLAPALPAIGYRLVPEHRGGDSFDLALELRNAEQRAVRIESVEFAFGPLAPLADLDRIQLPWSRLELETDDLPPPIGPDEDGGDAESDADSDAESNTDSDAESAESEALEASLRSSAGALSSVRLALGERVRASDPRALYFRATISTAAFEPRGDTSAPGDASPATAARTARTRTARTIVASPPPWSPKSTWRVDSTRTSSRFARLPKPAFPPHSPARGRSTAGSIAPVSTCRSRAPTPGFSRASTTPRSLTRSHSTRQETGSMLPPGSPPRTASRPLAGVLSSRVSRPDWTRRRNPCESPFGCASRPEPRRATRASSVRPRLST